MVEKRYEWADGATLEEHSRRKHDILREYVFDYLTVRCKLPQRERFRLAIVDGFADGGRYRCGSLQPGIEISQLFLVDHRLETGDDLALRCYHDGSNQFIAAGSNYEQTVGPTWRSGD